ncbi:MAG: hypothetical protein ACREC9_09800 [Methylocella sp.]
MREPSDVMVAKNFALSYAKCGAVIGRLTNGVKIRSMDKHWSAATSC